MVVRYEYACPHASWDDSPTDYRVTTTVAQPDIDDALLDTIECRALCYFLDLAHPLTGLVADSTMPDTVCSIAAVGMALGAYPVAVERGLLSRDEAVERTLRVLRFFRDSPQGEAAEPTGHRGFYYHFLDMETGRRAWHSELSTIDTALLLAGALAAACYFDGDAGGEPEIRTVADALYQRVDWHWALNGERTLTHGWRPESGFLPYRWRGYDEALILYILALGAPTHPITADSYTAWCATYAWKCIDGHWLLYAGPLFIHHFSHLWIDFRGIQDAFMRDKCAELGTPFDYFENSRRATLVQQAYAVRNPLGFVGYCDCCWGFTACHGPGPVTDVVDGVERRFLGYSARGAPYGPDDGTIAPWAAATSLPFAPEVVLPTLRRFHALHVGERSRYGFESAFNPTFPVQDDDAGGWTCPWVYGIDQGALALMLENHRTGLVWDQLRRSPHLQAGLRRAGFDGGWLDARPTPASAFSPTAEPSHSTLSSSSSPLLQAPSP